MATFPLIDTTPQPVQWKNLIGRQVLGGTAASIVFSGISAALRSYWLDIRLTKDGTAAGATLTLNSGGGVAYTQETQTSTTLSLQRTNLGTPATSVLLTHTGHTIAANRDGHWIVRIQHTPGKHACLLVNGGYFRGTSAVPVTTFVGAYINGLGSSAIATITIASTSGNFAASSAAVLNAEGY